MLTPIGISDFRTLIEYRDPYGNPYLFIDKSLLVKEILSDSHVILITRPRRFGKTLNMSLLHHFFAKEVTGKPTKHLFEHLEIAKHPEFMKYQGQYPVIFLTFKDIKSESFEEAFLNVQELMQNAYREHETAVMSSESLSKSYKKKYQSFLEEKVSVAHMNMALKNLIYYVHEAYGVKPIVLIDEYDTPIQAAYINQHYKKIVEFMRKFLSAGLKDNPYLEKAVLTGILRISKESIFSGLNHLKVYSLLHHRYGEFFGFLEKEVNYLLLKTNLDHTIKEVTAWYNGYLIGNAIIYNPWSIINYIEEKGFLQPYWINTSDNVLLKKLFIESGVSFKTQFESLIQGKTIEKLMNENFSFESLNTNESALWTLFSMAGYLKITNLQMSHQGSICQLSIPNYEVEGLLKTFIAEWLSGVNDAFVFNHFLNELLQGNVEHFEERLKIILLQTCSVHDVSGKNPEKFYHGFLLGLLSGIDPARYTIESNKEAGLGRFDILIVPNDANQLAIMLELKSIDKDKRPHLKKAAGEALAQIDAKQYVQTKAVKHIRHLLKIGIAFSGKELAIMHTKS
jgi:hypothetical protein